MKRIISKLFLAALLIALTSGSVFAASAKVTYVKGKVEVSRGNSWVALKVGDLINESETISTGFQSEARLNYNGSVMAVPALSRVTLETLQSSDTKETVSLKVDTGAVRSKVTHTEGKRIEYTARTSVAVASVRGTDFAVFANGKAKVFEGAIAYFKASDFIPPATTEATEDVENEDTGAVSTDTASEGATSGDTTSTEDKGPATATTTSKAIAESSPRGSTVVGAGQTSTISKRGVASKPVAEAKKRTTKAKVAVSTEAKKDVIAAAVAAASTDSAAQASSSSSSSSSHQGVHDYPNTPSTSTDAKVTVKVKGPSKTTSDNTATDNTATSNNIGISEVQEGN